MNDTTTLFNEYGHYIGKAFPKACVEACSHAGECFPDVERWQRKLGFDVPRDLAITYLREFGAWHIDELNEMTDVELAQKVFWIACCDIKENGEWFGLCH